MTINQLNRDAQSKEEELARTKQELEEAKKKGGKVTTRTVSAEEPEQCWLANHFEPPNPHLAEAKSATTAIIHCNRKYDNPV